MAVCQPRGRDAWGFEGIVIVLGVAVAVAVAVKVSTWLLDPSLVVQVEFDLATEME